jgi:hypothetical protein
LSERLREGNLIVIDELGFKNPKTKDFLSTLGTLGLATKGTATKTLIVDSLDNANLVLSSRNVRKTKITNSFGLNIYDIVYHEKLVISKSAVEELNNLLDPKRESGIAEPETAAPVEETKPAEKPKAKRTAKPKVEKAEKAPAKEKVEAAPVVKETAAEAPAEEAVAEAAPAEEIAVAEEPSAEDKATVTSEEAAKDE